MDPDPQEEHPDTRTEDASLPISMQLLNCFIMALFTACVLAFFVNEGFVDSSNAALFGIAILTFGYFQAQRASRIARR